MTAEDEEIAEYVAGIPRNAATPRSTSTRRCPKVDGDALAAEFERYLREGSAPGTRG